MPKSVEHALCIDEQASNLWWTAINKELSKVIIAFEVYDIHTPKQVRASKAGTSLVGYQEIRCYFIFDIQVQSQRCLPVCNGWVLKYNYHYC